jgi:hypothetical protein
MRSLLDTHILLSLIERQLAGLPMLALPSITEPRQPLGNCDQIAIGQAPPKRSHHALSAVDPEPFTAMPDRRPAPRENGSRARFSSGGRQTLPAVPRPPLKRVAFPVTTPSISRSSPVVRPTKKETIGIECLAARPLIIGAVRGCIDGTRHRCRR